MLYTAKTDTGRIRPHNEDSVLALAENGYVLLIVADGMGGHKAGEVASGIAVREISASCAANRSGTRSRPLLLRRAISDANRAIYARALEDPDASGMGTTATVMLIEDNSYIIGHVGDSRAYLLRDGRISQITDDHSYVAELVRMGQLTPEQARNHPRKNIITRALGVEDTVKVDTYSGLIEPGDVFLLCSDGLSNMLADDEINTIMLSEGAIEERAAVLVERACRNGGYDNVSVVLAADEREAGNGR